MKDYSKQTVIQPATAAKPKKRTLAIPIYRVVKILITFSVFAMILYSLYFFPRYFSRPINRESITVQGNEHLQKESILAFLPLLQHSTWKDADPFELSLQLLKHPWIERATVHRTINQGIAISLKEVEPVTYLRTENELFYLSSDYRILTLIQTGETRNLPVVVNHRIKNAVPGSVLPKQEFAKVFSLMSLLEKHTTLPLAAVSEIDITDPLNIQLVTIPDGVRIKLGSTDFETKLFNLKSAMPVLDKEKKNLRYIDLRYKRAVVFRRKV